MEINSSASNSPTSSIKEEHIPQLPLIGSGRMNFNISTTPPSHAFSDVVSLDEAQQELPTYTLATPGEQRVTDDNALKAILKKYLEEGKGREIDPELGLDFVQEQQRQLGKAEKDQDWTEAKNLYLKMQGITPEEFNAAVGGTFKGGWIGSGTVYGLSSQLSNFLSVVPSIYTASVPREKLQESPMHYALLNLGMQMGVAVMTPMINAAIQIPMVARQELMRSKGLPARSKEMSAPQYPKTNLELQAVTTRMQESSARMEEHSAEFERMKSLGLMGTPEWEARKQQMELDGEAAVALMADHEKLVKKFQVRKDVTELNYVSQYYLALNRVVRVAGTLAGQVVGTATKNSHLSAYIQIGTAGVTMGLQQFWAGPKGQFAKLNDTLMATMHSTQLVKEDQQKMLSNGSLTIDDLRPEHLDLEDVPKQWTRGADVGLGQFKEYLDLHAKYCEQGLADLVKMNPHEWRQLEALTKKAGAGDIEQGAEVALNDEEREQLTALKEKIQPLTPTAANIEKQEKLRNDLTVIQQDLEHIKKNDWLSVSPENRRILLQSVDGNHEWQTAFRSALVRMQLPSDFIPQVAQRFGAQFQMGIAGSNMPLIVSAVLRLVQARATEAHRAAVETLAQAPAPLNAMAPVVAVAPAVATAVAPVVSNAGRYAISSLMSLIGVAGAFSSGALVNDKITQRAELRKDAKDGVTPRVGFQPTLAARAMRAIGRSMIALPVSIKNRVQIEYSVRKGNNTQAQLQKHLSQAQGKLQTEQAVASSSQNLAVTDVPQPGTA